MRPHDHQPLNSPNFMTGDNLVAITERNKRGNTPVLTLAPNGSSLSAEPLNGRLADGFGLGQDWTETLIASSRKAMTSWISFRICPLPLADGE
jgi:hypothetical protein